MPVTLTNRQKTAKIDCRWLGNRARKLLRLLNRPSDELSVLLVDDEEMAALNGRYRSEQEATDVLAFPQQEGTERSGVLMGDVVISVETALRQSRTGRTNNRRPSGVVPRVVEAGNPLGDEILRLLIHGILHLLGYEHGTAAQQRRMRKEEGRCFQEIFVDENSAQIAKEAY